MFESEEKSPHILPVPLPKTKNGSSDDIKDNKAGPGDVVEGAAREQVEEDSGEEDETNEGP